MSAADFDETNRLLACLVRLQTDTQTEAILELHRSGIPAARIAQLLGTTANTANVAIQKAKKKPKVKANEKS